MDADGARPMANGRDRSFVGVLGVLGVWAVLCGALASNSLRWEGEDLLSLALIAVVADLGWGRLWHLATGHDWIGLLHECRPAAGAQRVAALPYTLPGSPLGRVSVRLGEWRVWWRTAAWPAVGAELIGIWSAAALTTVLAFFLPAGVRPLSLVLAGLVLVGIIARHWVAELLAGASLVGVGLGWLAGHLAFAPLSTASLGMAAAFSLAAWGGLRLGRGAKGALWPVIGGQGIAAVLLAWLKQPLPAGGVALLLVGQMAPQPWLRGGDDPVRLARRMQPWLLAAMLVAALALP